MSWHASHDGEEITVTEPNTFYDEAQPETAGRSEQQLLEVEIQAPPSWRELGVLVLDGSASMQLLMELVDESLEAMLPAKTKGAAVDAAVRELVNRLKSSVRASNFALSHIAFNEMVTDERPARDVLAIDAAESFDPTAHGVGGTAIHTGLEAAHRHVYEFLRAEEGSGLPLSAVVIVLSDGEDGSPKATLEAATRLKELPNTLVAAGLFATKGQPPVGAELLQAIASRPNLYQTVFNGAQLRDFFHASLTMAAQSNAGATGTDGE